MARGTATHHVVAPNTSHVYMVTRQPKTTAVFRYIGQQSRGRRPVLEKYCSTRRRSSRRKGSSAANFGVSGIAFGVAAAPGSPASFCRCITIRATCLLTDPDPAGLVRSRARAHWGFYCTMSFQPRQQCADAGRGEPDTRIPGTIVEMECVWSGPIVNPQGNTTLPNVAPTLVGCLGPEQPRVAASHAALGVSRSNNANPIRYRHPAGVCRTPW